MMLKWAILAYPPVSLQISHRLGTKGLELGPGLFLLVRVDLFNFKTLASNTGVLLICKPI